MRCRTLAFLLFIEIISTAAVLGDTGVPFVGWITMDPGQEVSLFVLPDGSGPPLTEARFFGGQAVDATIAVGVVDIVGLPITLFPWEDIWLDAETLTASRCHAHANGGFCSDNSTNAQGETFFATSLAGGGWTEGPVWVYLNGSRAMHPDEHIHPPVALRFNSADINADEVVNLVDISLFASDYFGGYHYRSDYNWDGTLNLLDIGLLATGLAASCD